MNESLPTFAGTSSGTGALSAQRNRVLRNTYWLLALSMLPTVLGAWVGVTSGLMHVMTGGMGFLVFMVVAMGFIFAINRTKESGLGVAVLLGFTFFMGVMLTPILSFVLGFSNGPTLIMTAFGGTALVFFGMASVATVTKRDLSGLGKFLTIGLLMIIAAGIINLFVHSSAMMLTISVLAIGLFSAFIVYDIKRVLDGGETNYITATLSIYLDLYNIFQNLLMLLGIFGGRRN